MQGPGDEIVALADAEQEFCENCCGCAAGIISRLDLLDKQMRCMSTGHSTAELLDQMRHELTATQSHARKLQCYVQACMQYPHTHKSLKGQMGER